MPLGNGRPLDASYNDFLLRRLKGGHTPLVTHPRTLLSLVNIVWSIHMKIIKFDRLPADRTRCENWQQVSISHCQKRTFATREHFSLVSERTTSLCLNLLKRDGFATLNFYINTYITDWWITAYSWHVWLHDSTSILSEGGLQCKRWFDLGFIGLHETTKNTNTNFRWTSDITIGQLEYNGILHFTGTMYETWMIF